jgi:hypothetical protein
VTLESSPEVASDSEDADPAAQAAIAAVASTPKPAPEPSTGERINAFLAKIREQERQQQAAERQRVEANAATWRETKQRAAALARTADATVDVGRRLELLRRAAELDPWFRAKYEAAVRAASATPAQPEPKGP